MSAPPFFLAFTDRSDAAVLATKRSNPSKSKKVARTLDLLRTEGPKYPGLNSHSYHGKVDGYTNVWESYVENRAPSAWRIWWVYGPDADMLTIVAVGPHP